MYSLQMMEDRQDLQDYANAIESALCAFDHSLGNQVNDDTVLKILELLLDTYYFKENNITSNDEIVDNGFAFVSAKVKEDLCEISEEVITKIIRTIYFVAKRRTKGQREYLDFIHQYVGIRLGKGMRILS